MSAARGNASLTLASARIKVLPGSKPGNPRKAYIKGVVIPRPEVESCLTHTEKKDNFTIRERKQLNLVGLPVSVEHEFDHLGLGNKESVVIGKIMTQKVNEKNELIISAEIDPHTEDGKKAMDDMLSGKIKGLSLAHLTKSGNVNSDTGNYKIPIEVSVCEEGRRPETDICELVLASKSASNIVINMSQPQTDATNPTAPQESNASNDAASKSSGQQQPPAKQVPIPSEMDEKMEGELKTIGWEKATRAQLAAEAAKQSEERAALAKKLAEMEKKYEERDKVATHHETIEKKKTEEAETKWMEENQQSIEALAKQVLEKLKTEQGYNAEKKPKASVAKELLTVAQAKAIASLKDPILGPMLTESLKNANQLATTSEEKQRLEDELKDQENIRQMQQRYLQSNGFISPEQLVMASKRTRGEPQKQKKVRIETPEDEDSMDIAEDGWEDQLTLSSKNDRRSKKSGVSDNARIALKGQGIANLYKPGMLAHEGLEAMDKQTEALRKGTLTLANKKGETIQAANNMYEASLFYNEEFMKDMGMQRVHQQYISQNPAERLVLANKNGGIGFDADGNKAKIPTAVMPEFITNPNAWNMVSGYTPILQRVLKNNAHVTSYQDNLVNAFGPGNKNAWERDDDDKVFINRAVVV